MVWVVPIFMLMILTGVSLLAVFNPGPTETPGPHFWKGQIDREMQESARRGAEWRSELGGAL